MDRPVDVFIICPTVDTKSETNALDLNDKLKERFINALDMERGIFDETGRLFSPYYRQMSINAISINPLNWKTAQPHGCEDIKKHKSGDKALKGIGFRS